MKSTLFMTLRCMLAVAVLAGGLSAWTSGAAHGPAPEQFESQSNDTDSHTDAGNCHPTGQAAGSESDSRDGEPDCCDDPADCQHESCDCACPALTLVVPPLVATAQHTPTPLGSSSLSARSPRHVTETPLRPPQA